MSYEPLFELIVFLIVNLLILKYELIGFTQTSYDFAVAVIAD